MRALPTPTSATSDYPARRRSRRYELLSLSSGCLALIGAPRSSPAPAAEIGAIGSSEQSKLRGKEPTSPAVEFTSIDSLKLAAVGHRDENASAFLVGTSEIAGPAAEQQGGRP